MKIWFVLVAACILISCKKENGNDPAPVGSARDSTWVLTQFDGGFFGMIYAFEYDKEYKKVLKLYAPYENWKNEMCYLNYRQDGLLSHLVWEYKNVNQETKRTSMIALYNANNQPVKIYCKKSSVEPINSAYFSTINDGKMEPTYDSLVWGANNRVQIWYRIDPIDTSESVLKYVYARPSDIAPIAMERYYVKNGVSSFYERMGIKTDSTDSYYKDLWWLGFLNVVIPADSKSWGFDFFINSPGTSMPNGPAFITKRIIEYGGSNYYNNYGAKQAYTANADSTVITISTHLESGQFKLIKVKK